MLGCKRNIDGTRNHETNNIKEFSLTVNYTRNNTDCTFHPLEEHDIDDCNYKSQELTMNNNLTLDNILVIHKQYLARCEHEDYLESLRNLFGRMRGFSTNDRKHRVGKQIRSIPSTKINAIEGRHTSNKGSFGMKGTNIGID